MGIIATTGAAGPPTLRYLTDVAPDLDAAQHTLAERQKTAVQLRKKLDAGRAEQQQWGRAWLNPIAIGAGTLAAVGMGIAALRGSGGVVAGVQNALIAGALVGGVTRLAAAGVRELNAPWPAGVPDLLDVDAFIADKRVVEAQHELRSAQDRFRELAGIENKADQFVANYDHNHDGTIDLTAKARLSDSEIARSVAGGRFVEGQPGQLASVDRMTSIDTDRDGKLSPSEYAHTAAASYSDWDLPTERNI